VASHVIYDLDGLLLDTEPFYTRATQQIVGRFGKTFDWSVKSRMMGRRESESARILVEALKLPISPEDYLRERTVLLDQMFPEAQPRPGAERLTRRLHDRGVPQAIASGSKRRTYDLKITRHREWFSVFDVVVTGDDPEVRSGKPAPDIFLVAARRLGATPAQCLVFEDSPSGAEAALSAGMSVVAVPDPNLDPALFQRAHRTITSLEQYDPADWQLALS
jgi:pseudouridine-5'-monophosphatase